MRITREDVGRKVFLRNGKVATIDYWDSGYEVRLPVRTDKSHWHQADGTCGRLCRTPERDIVAFCPAKPIPSTDPIVVAIASHLKAVALHAEEAQRLTKLLSERNG